MKWVRVDRPRYAQDGGRNGFGNHSNLLPPPTSMAGLGALPKAPCLNQSISRAALATTITHSNDATREGKVIWSL
jgi:hypothetical protein